METESDSKQERRDTHSTFCTANEGHSKPCHALPYRNQEESEVLLLDHLPIPQQLLEVLLQVSLPRVDELGLQIQEKQVAQKLLLGQLSVELANFALKLCVVGRGKKEEKNKRSAVQ